MLFWTVWNRKNTFGKTKVWAMIASGSLPLIKIGKDYITSWNVLEDWIRDNIGKEIYL